MKQVWFINKWIWNEKTEAYDLVSVGDFEDKSVARKVFEELPIDDDIAQYDLYEGFINKYGQIDYYDDARIAIKDCVGIAEKGEF